MAGELPAQEPDEKPGPGAGMGLMGWRDLDVLGVVAGVPVRAAALFPHGSVAPRPEKNDSPRSQSGFFNRLAEGDLVGALQDGDAVGNERVAQDVARLWDGGEGDELARVGHVLWHLGCGVRLRLGVGCGRWGVYEAGIFVFAAADYLCWWWGGGADE